MTMVAATAIPVSLSEKEVLAAYDKLRSIRDEVVARQQSALTLSNQSATQSNARAATESHAHAKVPPYRAANATSSLAQVSTVVPEQPPNLNVPKMRSQPLWPTSPNVQKLPSVQAGSSGIDPIFLTKSDVLVRAEHDQKRQRIEMILGEQVDLAQRQQVADQDALPDFDVTDVLKKAQELVKPIPSRKSVPVNGAASSNDSFDENTFYSSQMDESTTSEEADESTKRRPRPICNFFLRGDTCKYGRTCTFSHDPALRQKIEAESSRKANHTRNNANEQAILRSNLTSYKHIPASQQQPKPPAKEKANTVLGSQSQSERERSERIARLEAELRSAKAEQDGVHFDHAKVKGKKREEPTDIQSGPDEFGRDVALRAPRSQQHTGTVHIGHEYVRQKANQHSPEQDDVRVITNHIRSPVAPQPSRVSPLAVAKVAQVSQIQREHDENGRPLRTSNPDISSGGQSPHVASHPRSSRKRRRGCDSGEQARNVVPRIDQASPTIRVKEEPVSPPPFGIANPDVRRVRPRHGGSEHFYVDTAPPHNRAEEPTVYRSRVFERPEYGYIEDGRGPQTPVVRQVISRNGQHYIANEEPDLRRVVTAPRQMRVPMSPAPLHVQYSAPQPRHSRAMSQLYVSPRDHPTPDQYGSSTKSPRRMSYMANDRSPSPLAHRRPQSPTNPYAIPMAPPPARIVVDQWGHRFMEAPVPVGRHLSVAPPARGQGPEPRYEQIIPRSASVMRQPQIVRLRDEDRRASSPSVQSYYEVTPRQLADTRNGTYQGEPYVVRSYDSRAGGYQESRSVAMAEDLPTQDPRIIRLESVRPPERHCDSLQAPDERLRRMPSVRPAGRDLEVSQEHLQRVQSVRPEQPRIIPLGEIRDPIHDVSRQPSVLPDKGDLRTPGYAMEEQPRYRYAPQVQQGGYIEEIQDDGGYEAPGSGGRRMMQRM